MESAAPRSDLSFGPRGSERTHARLAEDFTDFSVAEVRVAAVLYIDPQFGVMFKGCPLGPRARFTGKLCIRLSEKPHCAGDLQQEPSISFDHFPDPLVGKTDMVDFVDEDVLQNFSRGLITYRPPDLVQSSEQIHLPGLKRAVLNREPGGQRVTHIGNGPFEISDRELALATTELAQPQVEGANVAALVKRLPRELHA